MLFRLAVLAAIIFGLYSLYQSPAYRGDLDRAWKELLSRIDTLQGEITQPVGDITSQTTEVRIPKSQIFDWQKIGTAGKEILSGRSALAIEVDYTRTVSPRSADTAAVATALEKYSGKKVEMVGGNEVTQAQESYTLADIVEITKINRSCLSSTARTCIYILFLPGKFENSSALGLSYTATATAFFAEQAEKSANPIAPRDRIARATLTHELGHLFGLINLTYKSDRDHEDPSHPGHSKNSGSVMYWAVEDLSISTLLSGGPPVNFDADDEADIAKIKASN